MIIGLTGPAGAGKDEIAKVLVNDYGYVRRAFADPLYEEVARAYGVQVGFLNYRPTKEKPMPAMALINCADKDFIDVVRSARPGIKNTDDLSPRVVLQLWGTEYKRAIDDDYWIKKLISFSEESGNEKIVVPDVRFDNEGLLITEALDGCVWRVHRDDVPDVPVHASAMGINSKYISNEITNNGTLSDLRDAVVRAVRNQMSFKPSMVA